MNSSTDQSSIADEMSDHQEETDAPEGLMTVYDSLGWTHGEHVAVKLSTGEPPACGL